MNFRILAASVWPRGRVFAVLATTILAVSFFVAGGSGSGTSSRHCAEAQAEGRTEARRACAARQRRPRQEPHLRQEPHQPANPKNRRCPS